MKSRTQKKWIPIELFMLETGVTKQEIYQRLKSREWSNGFVIKKSPCNNSKNPKLKREGKIIRWGCIEDFNEWGGLR